MIFVKGLLPAFLLVLVVTPTRHVGEKKKRQQHGLHTGLQRFVIIPTFMVLDGY